jgi:hypothetical protein
MKAKQIRLLWARAVLTVGLPLIGSTPLAAQGNCQPVLDAMNKVFATPSHIYRTMTPVSKDVSKRRTGDTTYSETIYVGESAYTKGVGSWRRSGATVEQVKKLEEGNIKSSKYTCRYLRDEPVNGEPAAVYSTHSEREDLGIRSDGQIWISKSRGLPLRQELEITESGDKPEVNHHSMRYGYTNVRPPL